MPPLLTASAQLMCPHGGRVTIVPKQEKVLAGGAPVLRAADLMGAPIAGCTLPPTPATVPCTAIAAVLPGSWASTVLVGGEPALLATLVALTNSVPPGPVVVLQPGQVVVEAKPG